MGTPRRRPSTPCHLPHRCPLHGAPLPTHEGQPRSSRVETSRWQKSVSSSPPPNTGNRAGRNLGPHLLGDATRAPGDREGLAAGRAGLRCPGEGLRRQRARLRSAARGRGCAARELDFAALPGGRAALPGAGLPRGEWWVLLFDWRAAGDWRLRQWNFPVNQLGGVGDLFISRTLPSIVK